MRPHDHGLNENGRPGAPEPEDLAAWFALEKIVARSGERIPHKYRALIAAAAAHAARCPSCIEVRSRDASEAGASAEELAEAAIVAAVVRSSGAAPGDPLPLTRAAIRGRAAVRRLLEKALRVHASLGLERGNAAV
jgi:AhpD family alkylhydroperoxidase